jgi:hypothetical protein
LLSFRGYSSSPKIIRFAHSNFWGSPFSTWAKRFVGLPLGKVASLFSWRFVVKFVVFGLWVISKACVRDHYKIQE